ncbi:site-specific integrase [Solibacillus sp. FSL W8-0474]|uniref:tyrosine-type recombinase/integrase n=1 Tax=Solibacillus sp. FSL W8-0474 TaxID=2975336 RepID=UPI0030FC84C7
MQNTSKKYPQIKHYQLKNGTTLFRFTIYIGVNPLTGKEETVTRSKFKTVKQAELAIEKLKFEFSNGLNPTSMLKTYNQVYEQWIESYQVSGVVMSTFSKTVGYFENHILPFFGERKLAKINVAMCEQFAIGLSKKLKYFHHIVNYASDVMETAITHGHIHANPFARAKIPKEAPYIKHDNFLGVKDIKKIIRFLPNLNFKAHCLLRLLIFSGMRKGEVLVLNWSNINFLENRVSINASYSYSKHNNGNNVGLTKNKQPRTIPLDPTTIQILLKWKELQASELKQLGLIRKVDSEQLIFNNTVNNYLKITYPNDYLKTAIEETRTKSITVHGLRHTHITNLIEAGADLFGVKDRVGHFHKNSITEEVYVHATDIIKQEVLQRLLNYYKDFDIK